MRIAFYGSSLVSSYWNGAATYYRGMIKALAALGHEVSDRSRKEGTTTQNNTTVRSSSTRIIDTRRTGMGLSGVRR